MQLILHVCLFSFFLCSLDYCCCCVAVWILILPFGGGDDASNPRNVGTHVNLRPLQVSCKTVWIFGLYPTLSIEIIHEILLCLYCISSCSKNVPTSFQQSLSNWKYNTNKGGSHEKNRILPSDNSSILPLWPPLTNPGMAITAAVSRWCPLRPRQKSGSFLRVFRSFSVTFR